LQTASTIEFLKVILKSPFKYIFVCTIMSWIKFQENFVDFCCLLFAVQTDFSFSESQKVVKNFLRCLSYDSRFNHVFSFYSSSVFSDLLWLVFIKLCCLDCYLFLPLPFLATLLLFIFVLLYLFNDLYLIFYLYLILLTLLNCHSFFSLRNFRFFGHIHSFVHFSFLLKVL
jgi:hypothetical protein